MQDHRFKEEDRFVGKEKSKLKKLLTDRSADFYIETLIGILLFVTVLSIGITITPVIISKIKTDYAADEIARYISLTGDTDIGADDISNILAAYGLNISDITVTADDPEENGDTRIQLSEGFSVKVLHPVSVSFGGFAYSFTVDITSVSRGRSEVYWKALDSP